MIKARGWKAIITVFVHMKDIRAGNVSAKRWHRVRFGVGSDYFFCDTRKSTPCPVSLSSLVSPAYLIFELHDSAFRCGYWFLFPNNSLKNRDWIEDLVNHLSILHYIQDLTLALFGKVKPLNSRLRHNRKKLSWN